MTVSLISQIAEVKRELAMRERVYPNQVRRGTLRQGEADLMMRHMRGVLASLEFLQAHESGIRAYVANMRGERA